MPSSTTTTVTTGTLQGHTNWTGGPTTPPLSILSGTTVVASAPIDASGHYRATVPPGTYTVYGRPTLHVACSGGPVAVAAGAPVPPDLTSDPIS